tara:strand:- start:30 stop:692 length:663 start_codon:yes stop_codon:yes gene_type:complete
MVTGSTQEPAAQPSSRLGGGSSIGTDSLVVVGTTVVVTAVVGTVVVIAPVDRLLVLITVVLVVEPAVEAVSSRTIAEGIEVVICSETALDRSASEESATKSSTYSRSGPHDVNPKSIPIMSTPDRRTRLVGTVTYDQPAIRLIWSPRWRAVPPRAGSGARLSSESELLAKFRVFRHGFTRWRVLPLVQHVALIPCMLGERIAGVPARFGVRRSMRFPANT